MYTAIFTIRFSRTRSRAALAVLCSLLFTQLTAWAQDDILLKKYKPKSIYNIPKHHVSKAKYPVIDMHSHAYAKTEDEIAQWVERMDSLGIQKTIILSYQTGKAFDSIYNLYSKYNGRFDVWCGFDYTGYNETGWSQKAIKELERCYAVGARGIGELGDKGIGLMYSRPTKAPGLHINDPRIQPLLKRCGELGMPVNVHVAEPIWMYQPIDTRNDGLMNAKYWRIDKDRPNILSHDQLVETLKEAVANNPNTIFIACHYANCSYDLNILGDLFDNYDNLYADISARFAEIGPIPRAASKFYKKYQDRLLYGTDLGNKSFMYKTTFRILETADEHFYEHRLFNYQWALNGLNLEDHVLKKIYADNAKKILDHQ
ncbi:MULTISPECIES: amidohydrolase family protein [Flavobacteriaceae]|uniref:amidohydrolase family protein n=1 Tax=Flavobacteriaceae TaxID=49546 RepID=UPI0014920627|nr:MULTISPECIES: amidohydrolase family protein [Allomuricauda]MDC6366807.1 amidohydrolase family protein [Muricauda sp. AC10]